MTVVLIAEDEESISDVLSYLLRREGFDIAVCTTGADALAAFDRNGADLVLLEFRLPGPPGIEVCRRLRHRSGVPVIMLTDIEADNAAGNAAGADACLAKPFTWRELAARIAAVLGQRVALRAQVRRCGRP